jgi:hypothetical protein
MFQISKKQKKLQFIFPVKLLFYNLEPSNKINEHSDGITGLKGII